MRWFSLKRLPQALWHCGLLAAAGGEFVAQGRADPTLSSPLFRDVKKPTLFYADTISYDKALAVWNASGHVEFAQEDRVLEADFLTYHEKTNLISARGNVRLREQNGEVLTATYVELTGDLKEGVLHEVRLLMADKSRLAARKAQRIEAGGKTIFQSSVYTPCYPCTQDSTKSALWQLNAREIVYDQVNHKVSATDPYLKFLGVPVAYAPHVSFSTVRSSGFLAPSFGGSSAVGTAVGVPYYWVLNDRSDATLNPFVTTKKGPLLVAQWRYFGDKMKLNLSGSVNRDKIFKGHIAGNMRIDFTDKWRLTADGIAPTQRQYFRTFRELTPFNDLWDMGFATSSLKVERFSSHDYLALRALAYRGLSDATANIRSPFAAPSISYHSTSKPLWQGSYLTYDGDMLSYQHHGYPSYQRLVNRVAWHYPYISQGGCRMNFFSSLRGDIYNSHIPSSALRQTVGQTNFNGATGRFFPQAGLHLRLALSGSWMIVEPTVQGIVSPHQGVDRKIPVVDCLGFEFNDTVLFRPNRLPGYDQVDSGSRVTYGATFIPKAAFLRTTRLFLGQTYSFGKPPGDLYGAGLMAKASDVVGNLQTNPHPWVSFDYRFRLARKNLSPAFSELFSALGPKIFCLSTSYIRASPNLTDKSIQKDQIPLKQISFNLSSEIDSNWKTEIFYTRNLKTHQALTQGLRLVFQNECLVASLSVGRSYYRSATIRPSTSLLFTVALKNLGGGNLKRMSSQNIPDTLKPLAQSPIL